MQKHFIDATANWTPGGAAILTISGREFDTHFDGRVFDRVYDVKQMTRSDKITRPSFCSKNFTFSILALLMPDDNLKPVLIQTNTELYIYINENDSNTFKFFKVRILDSY